MICCEVCKTEFPDIEPYDDGNCPKCGAFYRYDESQRLQLGEVVKVDYSKGLVTFKLKPEPMPTTEE